MGDIGIGIDIEEIDRFNDCLDDRRFLQKMFTEKEIKLLKKEHAIPSVAARFWPRLGRRLSFRRRQQDDGHRLRHLFRRSRLPQLEHAAGTGLSRAPRHDPRPAHRPGRPTPRGSRRSRWDR